MSVLLCIKYLIFPNLSLAREDDGSSADVDVCEDLDRAILTTLDTVRPHSSLTSVLCLMYSVVMGLRGEIFHFWSFEIITNWPAEQSHRQLGGDIWRDGGDLRDSRGGECCGGKWRKIRSPG